MNDYMTLNTGAFRCFHPFRESKTHPGVITKLDRPLREYLELDDDAQFKYNPENIDKLIIRYIRNANLDCWYVSPECDSFTPKSYIYPLPETYGDKESIKLEKSLPVDFFPKFLRLNSVSPKYIKPVYSLKESLQLIHESDRCKNVIELYDSHNFPNLLVFRDYQNLSDGVEYRCFIYNDKITAICTNDTKARQDLNDQALLLRIQQLSDKAQPWRPFHNIVQDVFISSESSHKDIIIEYAAFGAFCNTSSGDFNWLTDVYDLTSSVNVTIKRAEM